MVQIARHQRGRAAARLAQRAAEAGHGVMLAHAVLIRDELAGHRLVRLIQDQPVLRTRFAYYPVYPDNVALKDKAQTFRTWLLEQARESAA